MIETVTKTIDWLGIRKCLAKWTIRKVLKSYEEEIEKEIENYSSDNDKKCDFDCHHRFAAQGEVILSNDVCFNKELKNIIVDWKNKINDKIKDKIDKKEKFEKEWYEKELKQLRHIVSGIREGLGFGQEILYTIILFLLVGAILLLSK